MTFTTNLRLLRSLYQVIANNVLFVIVVSVTSAILLVIAVQFGFGEHIFHLLTLQPIYLSVTVFLLTAAVTFYLVNRPHDVYLVNYACFKPGFYCRVPLATFREYIMQFMPYLDERSIHFITRVLDRSGLGEETSLPPSLLDIPPGFGFSQARAEAELVLFSTIDDLFSKTCINPTEIDILIVNCSTFSPTPTYSDIIINRYKLRSDIRSVHLSGMG